MNLSSHRHHLVALSKANSHITPTARHASPPPPIATATATAPTKTKKEKSPSPTHSLPNQNKNHPNHSLSPPPLSLSHFISLSLSTTSNSSAASSPLSLSLSLPPSFWFFKSWLETRPDPRDGIVAESPRELEPAFASPVADQPQRHHQQQQLQR